MAKKQLTDLNMDGNDLMEVGNLDVTRISGPSSTIKVAPNTLIVGETEVGTGNPGSGFSMQGGTGDGAGAGGGIGFVGGNGSAAGSPGGTAEIAGGATTDNNVGGVANLRGGSSVDGNGGDANVIGGAGGTAATGGNVMLIPGVGPGANGKTMVQDPSSGMSSMLDTSLLASSVLQKFPNKDGTFAMLDDVPANLQNLMYGNSKQWFINTDTADVKINPGSVCPIDVSNAFTDTFLDVTTFYINRIDIHAADTLAWFTAIDLGTFADVRLVATNLGDTSTYGIYKIKAVTELLDVGDYFKVEVVPIVGLGTATSWLSLSWEFNLAQLGPYKRAHQGIASPDYLLDNSYSHSITTESTISLPLPNTRLGREYAITRAGDYDVTIQPLLVDPTPAFTGLGLNDMTLGTTFTGATAAGWNLTIQYLDALASSSVNTAGSGYAALDTFETAQGVTGNILTVGGSGEVLTYEITATGQSHSLLPYETTTAGSGIGFIINVDSVADVFTVSGGTGSYTADAVLITGAPQDVSDGMMITFTAVSGHTQGDSWSFSGYPVTISGAANLVLQAKWDSVILTAASETEWMVTSSSLASTGGVPYSGATQEIVAASLDTYTTAQLRNVIISVDDPSGGNNGDIWIKYTP